MKRTIILYALLIVTVFSLKGNEFDKSNLFIENAFADEPKVKVVTYEGLTVDFCKDVDAGFILRGLRNPADFEFEKAIAHANRHLATIETVFL